MRFWRKAGRCGAVWIDASSALLSPSVNSDLIGIYSVPRSTSCVPAKAGTQYWAPAFAGAQKGPLEIAQVACRPRLFTYMFEGNNNRLDPEFRSSQRAEAKPATAVDRPLLSPPGRSGGEAFPRPSSSGFTKARPVPMASNRPLHRSTTIARSPRAVRPLPVQRRSSRPPCRRIAPARCRGGC